MTVMWTQERSERFNCEYCEASISQGNGLKAFRGLHIANHYRKKHLWGNFYCSWCEFFAYMLENHSTNGKVEALCTECNENVPLNGNVHTLVEHYKECVES